MKCPATGKACRNTHPLQCRDHGCGIDAARNARDGVPVVSDSHGSVIEELEQIAAYFRSRGLRVWEQKATRAIIAMLAASQQPARIEKPLTPHHYFVGHSAARGGWCIYAADDEHESCGVYFEGPMHGQDADRRAAQLNASKQPAQQEREEGR